LNSLIGAAQFMNTVKVSTNQFTYQLKPFVREKMNEQKDNNAAQSASFVNSSPDGIKLAQSFQTDKRSTIYDQPNFKTSLAINTYKEVNNQQRRDEVEALIGVNIYA
jgi:hypothetical protein